MENTINKIYSIAAIGLIVLVSFQCRSPYVYPAIKTSVNLLHVEGVVDAGGDTTTITLSRTVALTDSITFSPELGATISVQGNDGSAYRLIETGNGNYIYPDLSAIKTSTKLYRLNIVTADGRTYQSDYVPIKNSPPIDSIYYQVKGSGVQVYSNTHDPAGNTRYYRWDFAETWVIYSRYISSYEAQTTPKDTLIARPVADELDSCWINNGSSTVVLNSSAKLSQDVISDNLIASFDSTSERFTSLYSMLLHQYALTQDAFNYWQNLKKNTEQLGSIFDAQPSQLQGNIHCTSNSSEPVLGYISMGAVTKKRIYIYKKVLPTWIPLLPYSGCFLDTIPLSGLQTLIQSNAIVRDGVYKGTTLLGYTISPKHICIDCTLRGTNRKPGYWPQ